MMPMPRHPFAKTENGFVYTRLTVSSRLRRENPYETYPSEQPFWSTREIGNRALNPVRT